MSKKELKTNAMRILDRNKIPYEYETYECDEFVDGITTADKIGLPHEQVYKTLVTVGKTGGHYVFVIPIAADLDLKKAAKSVGEKSVEMCIRDRYNNEPIMQKAVLLLFTGNSKQQRRITLEE